MENEIKSLAENHAVATPYNCPNCDSKQVGIPTEAFMQGWDARDKKLHSCLIGEAEASSAVEVALKAYGMGYEEGQGDQDSIYTKFQDFAKKVYDTCADAYLVQEAKEFMTALEASKSD